MEIKAEVQLNNIIFKGHLLCPFLQYVISLRCPQNVSVKFQLKIPHRSFIIPFWKCLFWVEVETRCSRACIFKCKWAAATCPLFQNREVPFTTICLVLIIMSIALKSCLLKPYYFKLLIDVFLSANIHSTRIESGCTRYVRTNVLFLTRVYVKNKH